VSGISIKAISAALPGENGVKGTILTGEDLLLEKLGTSKVFTKKKTLDKYKTLVRRLENKTGIKTRNLLFDTVVKYPNTYLGVLAGKSTLEKAGIDPSKVQGFYYGTDTPDFVFPTQGIAVAKLLGIKPIQIGNSSLACATLGKSLYEASDWIDRGLCDNALILLGDVTSRLRLPHNDLERYIFGDGFVGIFVEKGKGGITFTNLGIDNDGSDIFVHNQIYPSQLGFFNSHLQDNFQYNDAGLDILGDIDAIEYSYGLEDYLNNTGEKIEDKTKIVTPQGGKNAIKKGIEIFKANTKIDITPNIVENSSYKHGNIGAGAAALSILEGGVTLNDDIVLASIAGVGGVKTVFEINPAVNGMKTVRLDKRRERPNYREIIEKTIEELRKKGRKGKFDVSELTMSDSGEIKFKPIKPGPKQLSTLEKVVRSVSNDAAL